jgi:hypothetical protein
MTGDHHGMDSSATIDQSSGPWANPMAKAAVFANAAMAQQAAVALAQQQRLAAAGYGAGGPFGPMGMHGHNGAAGQEAMLSAQAAAAHLYGPRPGMMMQHYGHSHSDAGALSLPRSACMVTCTLQWRGRRHVRQRFGVPTRTGPKSSLVLPPTLPAGLPPLPRPSGLPPLPPHNNHHSNNFQGSLAALLSNMPENSDTQSDTMNNMFAAAAAKVQQVRWCSTARGERLRGGEGRRSADLIGAWPDAPDHDVTWLCHAFEHAAPVTRTAR